MIPDDLPIIVTTGLSLLDMGEVSLHKAYLWFYRYLAVRYTHKGEPCVETLRDPEAWLLAQVLMLRQDHHFALRLSNLPLTSSQSTLENYMAKLRRMGLVFTRRLYYTREQMARVFGPDKIPATPRQYAQQWDLTTLYYNLNLIAQSYLTAQHQVDQEWQAKGQPGQRPVITPSDEFIHEIQLPLEVAQRLVNKKYDPMPQPGDRGPNWLEIAQQVVSASPTSPAPAALPKNWAVRGAGGAALPKNWAVREGENGPHCPKFGQSLSIPTVLTPADAGGAHSAPLARASDSLSATGDGPIANRSTVRPDGALTTGNPGDQGNVESDVQTSNSSCDVLRRLNEVLKDRDTAQSFLSLLGTIEETGGLNAASFRSARIGVGCPQDRRERVLEDLRKMRARADLKPKTIQANLRAIIAQNVGMLIGLGLEADGRRRTVPRKEDYGSVGQLVREYGAENVWLTACDIAGARIGGDPLDYLRAALQGQRQKNRPSDNTFEGINYSEFDNV